MPISVTIGPGGSTVDTPGDYDLAFVAATGTMNFSGPGTYTVDGVTAEVASTYGIEASNGADVVVNGLASALSTADLIINGASTLSFSNAITALSAVNATFTGAPGGQLIFPSGLLSLLATPPVVTGLQPGDAIGFGDAFSPSDTFTYNAASGLLTLNVPPSLSNLTGIGGEVTLSPAGNYTAADFGIVDPNGTAEIIYKTAIPCFLRGTAIRTPAGDVPVETLRVGDLVTTIEGPKPITGVRIRSFEIGDTGDDEIRPIRIAAGALADNIPARDLFVSPEHAMHLDGVLVLAGQLQNGRTIHPSAQAGRVDYIHIEIDPHGILIAEGAEAESYLDIGNRGHFLRPGTISLLPTVDPKTWEDACAPLVLAGPVLETIRGRLAARAAQSATKDKVARAA